MTRLLALDFGKKRIGVAVSDPLAITAQALAYVPNSPKVFKAISALVSDYDVSELILGLPKSMSGEEEASAARVRKFADRLAKHLDLPITFVDERLSTVAVERHLIEADVSRAKRKEVVDSQAAQFILQGELDRRR